MTFMEKIIRIYTANDGFSRFELLVDKQDKVIFIDDYILCSGVISLDVEDSGWSQIVKGCV